MRFISCYCTFIYTEYVILLFFVINHHKTLLISQIPNKFLSDIFKGQCLLQTTRSTTYQNLRFPRQSKIERLPHRANIERQRYIGGSEDRGEGDCDSNLNRLYSVLIRQYTTVTKQC